MTGGRHQAAGTALHSGPAEPRTPVWNPTRNPPAMSRTPLARQAPPEPDLADDISPRPARRRRRRVLLALVYVVLAASILFVGRLVRGGGSDPLVVPPPPATQPVKAEKTQRPEKPRPAAGTSGQFVYAPGTGPILGRAGRLHRFHVAVEKPAGPGQPALFAEEVDRTLGDHRSWIAGSLRLQRVPPAASADFTIYLASARTSEKMCRTGGLETDGYTSCRVPGKVILNDDRWESSIRGYGAPLATYRAYAINHEVGHQLGHGHETCPGRGKPAPVMMQQTLGLKGCVANSWPYRNGKRY
ncbi:DUF3152 domain-containing protein [Actinoplanes sp. CA-030573]|uniref:DUF3152 domain-containing protein n=1 Tax=Actinoplanes sp. CA-030573 TaxID=3239898 RepID=UPI003D925C8B